MVEFDVQTVAPHIEARMQGRVTMDGFSPLVQPFEQVLARMPEGFVLLVDQQELEGYDGHMMGVFVYLARCVLLAEPGAILVVTGCRGSNRTMLNRLHRLDHTDVLHFFASREEADRLIRRRFVEA